MGRVVLTGIGAVSPLGNSFDRSWEAALAGRSGIGLLSRFDSGGLPWSAAGEVKDFNPGMYLSPKEIRRLDPFTHYAVAAAVMAASDAGLIPSNSSPITRHPSLLSAGVLIGSSRGGIRTVEREMERSCRGSSRISPYTMPSSTIGMAASAVAVTLGIRGHCLGISNACTSGANAIGEAFRLIKSNHLRVALAGGSEAPLCRFCIEGYGNTGALSQVTPLPGERPGVPRPFDKARDGFVLGEGASVLLLEDLESAVERKAKIYAEIAGYGNTSDAFHMTRPDSDGESWAMLMAMEEAGTTPDDVDYINTHGTATEIGDITEARAIRTVFGRRSSVIAASALKSMTGHMLAASGALETAFTAMTLRGGVIPPTINLDEREPACDLNVVTEKTDREIRIALTNSFGFGGTNAVLLLRKYSS